MAKNCEECGKELSFRNSFVFDSKSVCKECLTNLESAGNKFLDKELKIKGKTVSLGLCPFSWIEVTKPAGCLSSIFGGTDKLVSEPQICMSIRCQLWDSSTNNCGLLTKH